MPINDYRNFLSQILFGGGNPPGTPMDGTTAAGTPNSSPNSVGGFKLQQLMDYFSNPEMANQLSQQNPAPYFNTNAPSTRMSIFLNNIKPNPAQQLTPAELAPPQPAMPAAAAPPPPPPPPAPVAQELPDTFPFNIAKYQAMSPFQLQTLQNLAKNGGY